MSTTPAVPEVAAAPAVDPRLTGPVVGQPIAVAFFDGKHNVHFSMAHVLSLGPIDIETGKPTISVAYPDPDAVPSILSSASWFKGYVRQTGVPHVSSPKVQEGQVSVAYGNLIELGKADEPDMPKPAGDGANPVFDRDDVIVPTQVSIGQAALAQGAKVPGPSVASPLINEDVANPAPAVETKTFTDGSTATGVAPLPDQSPSQQDAANPDEKTPAGV